jgi:hypothetical protein
MEGLYACSIVAAGSALASMIFVRRNFEATLSRKIEFLFFFVGLVVWTGAMADLTGPTRNSLRPFENSPASATFSNDRVSLISNRNVSEMAPMGGALDYGALEIGAGDGKLGSINLRALDRWTAVYDISAHTVYLPNGAMLEAHSGLGPKLDNPRFVHERMRGATPPHIYELAFREKPFHGIRALRLKPVGGKDNIFGRTGLLAHTYMLGPKGDSNGCVVFKEYDAFLQAFESGEVKRLVVVASLE